MIMLDAAYPPSPSQLVADLRACGAGAHAWYVYGGITRYTSAHLDALSAAGVLALPIVVPGDIPPDYGTLAQDLSSSGVQGGPVVVDLERYSMPPAAWVAGLPAAIPGVRWGRYGTTGTLAGYPALAFDWVSWWPNNQQSLAPIPASIPNGWAGWQYAHAISINGSGYDASVIDPAAIFEATGGADLTPEETKQLGEVHTWAFSAAINTQPGFVPNPDGSPSATKTMRSELDEVHTWAYDAAVKAAELLDEVHALKAELDAIKAQMGPGAAVPTNFTGQVTGKLS